MNEDGKSKKENSTLIFSFFTENHGRSIGKGKLKKLSTYRGQIEGGDCRTFSFPSFICAITVLWKQGAWISNLGNYFTYPWERWNKGEKSLRMRSDWQPGKDNRNFNWNMERLVENWADENVSSFLTRCSLYTQGNSYSRWGLALSSYQKTVFLFWKNFL